MDPDEFLVMAQDLMLLQPINRSEAYARTVVNRAYLGALMATAIRLQSSLGITFQRSHNFYSNVEETLGETIGHRASRKLAQLRRWRLDADYDLSDPANPSLAKESLHLASELIAMINEKL